MHKQTKLELNQAIAAATGQSLNADGSLGELAMDLNLAEVANLLEQVSTFVNTLPGIISQAKLDVRAEILGGVDDAWNTLQEIRSLDITQSNVLAQYATKFGQLDTQLSVVADTLLSHQGQLSSLSTTATTALSLAQANATAITNQASLIAAHTSQLVTQLGLITTSQQTADGAVSKNTTQDTTLGSLSSQLATVQAYIITNTADIQAVQVLTQGAITKNASQDSLLTSLQNSLATQLGLIQTSQTTADGAVAKNTTQDGLLSALQTGLTTQTTKNTSQDTSITALNTLVSNLQALVNSQGTLLQTAQTGVDTGLAKNNSQDASINSINTLLATLQSNITSNTSLLATHTSTLASQATDITNRLLRSGDTATGSIMVPQATQNAAAPRFDQTYGGLNAPYRSATNIGSTPIALGPGALTDPTPQGRKAQVVQIYWTMTTAPTLGASVTVKIGTTAGGSEVYSKTYLLAALPVLSTLLTAIPTTISLLPAGTVLYATVVNNILANSPGVWSAIVQSFYTF